jgi:hypothetical protein
MTPSTVSVPFEQVLEALLMSRNAAAPVSRTFLCVNLEEAGAKPFFRTGIPLTERLPYSYERSEQWIELPPVAGGMSDEAVRALARAWAQDRLHSPYSLPYNPHIEISWDEEELRLQQVEQFLSEINVLQERYHMALTIIDGESGLSVSIMGGPYYPVRQDKATGRIDL